MKLSDEHLMAIGRVALRHTHLEFTLSVFIVRLLGTDQRTARAVTPRMVGPKLTLLRRLFEMRSSAFPDVMREFRALMAEVDGANKARNQLMHALVWGRKEIASGEWVPAVYRYDKDVLVGEAMPVERVEKIADDLHGASVNVSGFISRHIGLGDEPQTK